MSQIIEVIPGAGQGIADMGNIHHFDESAFRQTFGELEEFNSGALDRAITEAQKIGVFRTLEIGANNGNAILPAYEFLKRKLPKDLPIQMEFVDLGNYSPAQSIQKALNESVRCGDDGMPIDTFVYHSSMDAIDYIEQCKNEGHKFSLIYGYGIEYLILFPDEVPCRKFLESIENQTDKLLSEQALLMFLNGYPSGEPEEPLILKRQGNQHSFGATLIEQYDPDKPE